MKLIYLTGQRYPSKKVDPFYWKSMAGAFQNTLGDKFSFVIRDSKFDGLNTICVPAPKHFKSIYYFFVLPSFVSKHGWNSSEVVIFASDSYLLPAAIFWKKIFLYQYRVVSDWHQLFGDWRDKYIAKNSDLLITTSKKLKNLLITKCGIDERKINVAYGGVDPKPFEINRSKEEIRKELGLKEGFLVGYVGGFKSVGLAKGLDTMIRALKSLDVTMVFVGGSKAEIDDYKSLAEELGVIDRCVFVEKQLFEKVVKYELAMDVLVIPYPNQEHFREYGFPLKVWEYLAAGRPIVYSNLEIIDEILSGHGTSFEADNPQDLAGAILSLQGENKTEAPHNREMVRGYTWEARAKNILDFINK